LISIYVNGVVETIAADQTLNDIFTSNTGQLSMPLPERYAVALNENFVPKSAYQKTLVQMGDRIEILVAMQGG